MAVGDVLTSQRQWGDLRCRKFLTRMGMQQNKTIGSMTERQRRAVAAGLRVQDERPAPTIAAT
jgi:hypothetical protein